MPLELYTRFVSILLSESFSHQFGYSVSVLLADDLIFLDIQNRTLRTQRHCPLEERNVSPVLVIFSIGYRDVLY